MPRSSHPFRVPKPGEDDPRDGAGPLPYEKRNGVRSKVPTNFSRITSSKDESRKAIFKKLGLVAEDKPEEKNESEAFSNDDLDAEDRARVKCGWLPRARLIAKPRK
jgi:hypothetical protein